MIVQQGHKNIRTHAHILLRVFGLRLQYGTRSCTNPIVEQRLEFKVAQNINKVDKNDTKAKESRNVFLTRLMAVGINRNSFAEQAALGPRSPYHRSIPV